MVSVVLLATTSRILPFRFCRQAIAVGALVPRYGVITLIVGGVVIIYRVRFRQHFLVAQRVAVLRRVKPAYIVKSPKSVLSTIGFVRGVPSSFILLVFQT
jgi:hypothetical protein